MAKKIPVPKSTTSFPLSSTLIGLASLFNRRPLMLSKLQGTNPASWGTKAWRANKLANLSKMGKLARMGRFAAPALMNPWLAVPAALLGGAKYAVSKSFAPYKDAEGNWTDEGNARMLRQRLAREDLIARRNAAREEGKGFWELARMRDNPDEMYENEEYLKHYGNILRENQLSEADWKESFNEGGIARLL